MLSHCFHGHRVLRLFWPWEGNINFALRYQRTRAAVSPLQLIAASSLTPRATRYFWPEGLVQCPSSPWSGLPMLAMNAFIGLENVLVSLNSSPLLLLLVSMLPSSLAQRVDTSQGPVIGQRWYQNIPIFIFQKLFQRLSEKFQNIFHWLSV